VVERLVAASVTEVLALSSPRARRARRASGGGGAAAAIARVEGLRDLGTLCDALLQLARPPPFEVRLEIAMYL